MGRPLRIEWKESEEELYQRYSREKDVEKKQKYQLLWLLRGGRTIRESSHLTGIQERVGQRYVRWYKEGGIEEVLRRRHGGDRGKQKRYLSAEQEAKLKEKADKGELKTIWEGIEWVKKEFKITYKYGGMRGVFKRLGLKKKVPRKQHIKSDPEVQGEWKKGAWLTS